MTARVLVTGGAGYIGSIVVDQLLARGFRVTVLDDFSTGHRAAVAEDATMVEGGIGDRAVVERLLAREPVDAIVHLAAFALVAESVANPEKYQANNVAAARVLLAAAVAAGVRRFVFSSSCAVYGHPVRVADIADAHVRALDVPADGAVALNLGTGTGHSVRQVVASARRVTGCAIATADRPRRPGDPPELVAAAQRAAAVLGWRPRRSSLDEILDSAWHWHRAHPRGYRS